MTEGTFLGSVTAFFVKKFDGIIRIELIDEPEALWVDGRCAPPSISAASPKDVAQHFCLWRLERADVGFVLAVDQPRIESSFVSGRVKISGDMAVMARLELADE